MQNSNLSRFFALFVAFALNRAAILEAQEERQRSLPSAADFERQLGKMASHPRLLASSKEFQAAKASLENEPLKTWYRIVKERAALELKLPLIGQELSKDTLEGEPARKKVTSNYMASSRAFLVRALDFAFLAKLAESQDDEKLYAERLFAEIQSLKAVDKWDTPGKVFLISSELATAVAISYDWLYDYWNRTSSSSNDRLGFIAELLASKFLTPALDFYHSKAQGGFGKPDGGNWGVVCNSAVLMAAIALGNDDSLPKDRLYPKRNELIHLSMKALDATIFRFREDDGAWFEGPGYWHYSTMFLVNTLASLGTAFRTDFGLIDRHDLHKLGWFPIYATGPRNFLYYKEKKRASLPQHMNFNFGDASEGPAPSDSYMFWLANRIPKAKAQFAWWGYEGRGLFDKEPELVAQLPKQLALSAVPSPLDFLWFVSPDVARAGVPAPGLKVFGNHGLEEASELKGTTKKGVFGLNLVTIQSSFEDADATYLFCKGGANGDKHGQLDLGSFLYGSVGQRWIVDLGSDNYVGDYFGEGGQRWSFYRASAEANNTLILDDKATPQQLKNGNARIISAKSLNPKPDTTISSVILDLSGAYDVSMKNGWRVNRGFLLHHQKGILVVQDEVDTRGKSTSFWSTLHFPRYLEIELAKDGRSAKVRNPMSDRVLLVTVLSQGTVLKQDESDIAPKGLIPKAGQLDNADYHRIRLVSPSSNTPINAVELYPLFDSKTTEVKHSEFRAIKQWPK